jgi:hypothetical protein
MSDNGNFGFAKLVPGFDFLQNLTKGAGIPQMPNLSSWVAPTLSVEELEKRISELKAVHFWLDQNGKALVATIQALEVQKMTLATLEGMNFKMGDLASALQAKTPGATARPKASTPEGSAAGEGKEAAPAPAAVDPLQWWGALTQQFQEIASNAMQDVAQNTAMDSARNAATEAAREAMKAATGMAKAAADLAMPAKTAAPARAPATAKKKAAARKSAPRKGRSST